MPASTAIGTKRIYRVSSGGLAWEAGLKCRVAYVPAVPDLPFWARIHDVVHFEARVRPRFDRARLDRWLYAQDLWTTVSYRHASSVWCPAVASTFTKPRCGYPDTDRGLPVPYRYPPDREALLPPLKR